MAKGKLPKGPHALTKAAEKRETKAQERAESPAFERMERKMGLEKHGAGDGKNFIQKAIKKPGALHAQLGVPQGKKIPAGKLDKAAAAPGKLGQRARFAQVLKGLKK